MTYRIRIEQIGQAGTPFGQASLHEAATASEALSLAAHELGSGWSGARRTATIIDPVGFPVLVYTGRGGASADADRG